MSVILTSISFQLNIEPNHTSLAGHGHKHGVVMTSKLGMLGSIDAKTGSPDLGWDTDQFPMDIKNTTFIMKVGVIFKPCLHERFNSLPVVNRVAWMWVESVWVTIWVRGRSHWI